MNLTDSNPKQTLCAIITTSHDHGHYHIKLAIKKFCAQSGKIENFTSFDDSEYDSLHITCQANDDMADRHLFAFHVEYLDVYYINNANQLMRMAKLLTKVERGLEKIKSARGPVLGYADYVGRVGQILGIKNYLRCRKAGHFYEESEYTVYNPGDGIGFIHGLETRWLENDVKNAMVA